VPPLEDKAFLVLGFAWGSSGQRWRKDRSLLPHRSWRPRRSCPARSWTWLSETAGHHTLSSRHGGGYTDIAAPLEKFDPEPSAALGLSDVLVASVKAVMEQW